MEVGCVPEILMGLLIIRNLRFFFLKWESRFIEHCRYFDVISIYQ